MNLSTLTCQGLYPLTRNCLCSCASVARGLWQHSCTFSFMLFCIIDMQIINILGGDRGYWWSRPLLIQGRSLGFSVSHTCADLNTWLHSSDFKLQVCPSQNSCLYNLFLHFSLVKGWQTLIFGDFWNGVADLVSFQHWDLPLPMLDF